MKKVLFALAFVAGTAAFAHAQRVHVPTPQAREYHQDLRIRDGLRRGTLTPREAARLEAQQREVDRAIRRARADGFVSPRERAHIDALQDHIARNITHESRDFDRRGRF